MAVVTRWYGGIKLGAGGLVRAYGGSAAECLRSAERRELIAMQMLRISCPFDELGHVHAQLASLEALKQREDFDEHGAVLQVSVAQTDVDTLKTRLRDATRDRVRLSPLESHD